LRLIFWPVMQPGSPRQPRPKKVLPAHLTKFARTRAGLAFRRYARSRLNPGQNFLFGFGDYDAPPDLLLNALGLDPSTLAVRKYPGQRRVMGARAFNTSTDGPMSRPPLFAAPKKDAAGLGGSLFHSALVWIGGKRHSPRETGPAPRTGVDRPDLPSHISALLSGTAQFVRPRGTIKQVPDFGSPPVNLGFVACGVTRFAYLLIPR
jgi:hypothetical protein